MEANSISNHNIKQKQICSKRKAESDSSDINDSLTSKRTNSSSPYSSKVKLPRLGLAFYNQPCITLAKQLLGKTLVRILDGGERLSGKIVETEAYLGIEDTAAHSYQGKRTERNAAMFMTPGTSYVYLIYGMYSCLNVSSKGE